MNVHLLTIPNFRLAQAQYPTLKWYGSVLGQCQVIPLSCGAYGPVLIHKVLLVRKNASREGSGIYDVLACTGVRAMGLFSSNGNEDVMFDADRVETTTYIRL
jgi:hypothetical protein